MHDDHMCMGFKFDGGRLQGVVMESMAKALGGRVRIVLMRMGRNGKEFMFSENVFFWIVGPNIYAINHN